MTANNGSSPLQVHFNGHHFWPREYSSATAVWGETGIGGGEEGVDSEDDPFFKKVTFYLNSAHWSCMRSA